MNKKLVTKICTFLLENNVKAHDIYFHCTEIYNKLSDIERARNGVADENIH